MLGLDGYGSDDGSDRSASPPPPSEKSAIAPTKAAPKSAAPASKTQRPAKKITITLPNLTPAKDASNTEIDNERPIKKRKTGAGVSSLLSMLPPPKEVNPALSTQRVLGGGSGRGLEFKTQSSYSASLSTQVPSDAENVAFEDQPTVTDDAPAAPSTLFRPTSLTKGKRNISVEESNIYNPVTKPPTIQPSAPSRPAQDFFSFSSISSSSKSEPSTAPPASTSEQATSLVKILSAAPELPIYEPPEPMPSDPYPGYYQLPSGTWAAYDTEYYAKFMKKWEKEYNAHVRALEKGTVKGFEGLQNADVEEIDALKEMEKAKKDIQEREQKKAITQGAGGAPVAPKMNINASKLSGIARSRHQLSTLLKEAYENREALEERIAQGKRNRKEAGNKYGF